VRHTYLDVPIATYGPLNEFTTLPDVNCAVYRVPLEFSADKWPAGTGTTATTSAGSAAASRARPSGVAAGRVQQRVPHRSAHLRIGS
jgi:hypothetical protein